MATTKKPSTTNRRSRSAPKDQTLLARSGRTVRDRPYASAAIATGAVTAVAAAAAGAYFFSRNKGSFKDAAANLAERVKDGLADAKSKVKSTAERASRKIDGIDEKSQTEIAEEALTLKETGVKTTKPADPLIEDQLKAGAVSY
ncbi:MAG: hypothetical protein H0W65_00505 [Sphingomonas sp.]|uniref:hypothetical protein n=1 Tax=Sphingomonas sp. TaxID=28214 RepID=UPI0017FD88E3|nr:hypothetical protein [Sphingomonas sp.]MBA3666191.1 hypothetical protein [Sphingomonas sp.]